MKAKNNRGRTCDERKRCEFDESCSLARFEQLTFVHPLPLPCNQGSTTSPQIRYPAFMIPRGLTLVERAKKRVARRRLGSRRLEEEGVVEASIPLKVRKA